MKSTPRGRTSPRRISPSPWALRRRDSTPESKVERVRSAHTRNSSPSRVRVVLRPLRSKRGTPSSDSSWPMAWLRLG